MLTISMIAFDVLQFRNHFPLLATRINDQALVYLDNGATTQKPASVIEAIDRYYRHSNANVHRGSHHLSNLATKDYEAARVKVKHFINAASTEEIIWTKGTTESVNLIAHAWGGHTLKPGDEIVLTQSEHHANIVPWQLVAEKVGAIIKVLPLTSAGVVDLKTLTTVISAKTRLVCCAHISNVVGKINPIDKIINRARAVGAITVIDGAQAIAHLQVDVQLLNCDFYLFSAHKMYGPTGVGVLYGRKSILEKMVPYQAGGEMIEKVSFSGTSFNKLPFKFEAGTPNISGVIALSEAVKFLQHQFQYSMVDYEEKLRDYCYQKLSAIPTLDFIVDEKPDVAIFSFTLKQHHNHDIASALDSYGVAVRSGHHCAMPLMAYLALDGCIRVSLAPYNTFAEVDYLAHCLKIILNDHENIDITAGTQQRGDSLSADTVDKSTFENKVNSHTVLEQTIAPASQALITLFEQAKGWDGKHRQIMLLGKQLVRMDKDLRSEQTLISGCESLAWLAFEKRADNSYHFSCDSDAKIIRGLLMIVLSAFNDKLAQDIINFDIESYFEQLGLIQHLSPSRGNGILAIVARVITIVKTR
jgi:cysteine desulfurase/selenocysteine lyase